MPGRFLKSVCTQVVALAIATPVAAHAARVGVGMSEGMAWRDGIDQPSRFFWVTTKGSGQGARSSGATSRSPSGAGKAAASKPAAKKKTTGAAKQSGPATHTVRAGESLSSIGRRYGVSAAQLMQANGLSSGAVIRPGQRLVLPGKGSEATPAIAKSTPAPAAKSGAAAGGLGRYTVRRGETVRGLAARFGLTEKDFMQLNGLKDPTKLRAGAVVKYPLVGAGAAAVAEAAGAAGAADGTQEEPLPRGWQWHAVEPGESLSRIAARYGRDRASLERANDFSPDTPIHEGLRLKIPPPGVTLDPSPPVPARRPPRGQDHSVLAYRVRKGDTLEGLAETFLTTPAILRKLNRLSSEGELTAGQRIVVPNNLFE
ncbi:MAG: LysM peptidoglycan-binding domain-containing protein [Verrucomicrobiales bacterium]